MAEITRFGRYTNLKLLGQGGMAKVFQAHDPLLERTVALKFVCVESPALAERLAREARAQAKVEHEHICKVYEVGEMDGRKYIAMQFVSGLTLNEAAIEMSLTEKVMIMIQVSEALHAAHGAGLIHRDLKPANIMVEKKDDGSWVPFVVDFGLAREVEASGLTVSGLAIGTPGYMSPEQARGDLSHINIQSDVYSIGATLYELMAGMPPFRGESQISIILKALQEEPASLRNAGIPADLETIILKCLEKEPNRRYESARSLADDLRLFLKGDPVHARPSTWAYRLNKKIRKNAALTAISLVASIAILVTSGIAAYTWWRSQQQTRLANEFDQELQYVQERLRHMYSADIHDIRTEKSVIKERLKQIESRIQREGTIAYGPGFYLLGQGHLALNEYETARAYLDQAWGKYDYRLPQVAYAQGLALAMLYRKELARAKQIVVPERREARKKELEREFRDPALRFIRQGRSATQAPEYVEALIAFLETNYDDALQKTEIAQTKLPWFYESRILKAEILSEMAREKQRTGDVNTSLKLFREADESYSLVIREAPGEVAAYVAMARTQADILLLLVYQTNISPEAAYEKGRRFCRDGLTVDPDEANLYVADSDLCTLWGEYLIRTGRDGESVLLNAIVLAEKALSFAPDNPMACDALGKLCIGLAQNLMDRGKDPDPLLDKAIRTMNQGLIVNPRQAMLLGHLGNAYSLKAHVAFQTGQNPAPFSDKAIESFEKSLAIPPDNAGVRTNLCMQLGFRGNFEMETGSDPNSFYDRAAQHCEQAVKLNPSYADASSVTGTIYYWKAKYEALHGLDPRKSFDIAVESYRRKNAIQPSVSSGYADACETLNLQAAYFSQVGLDAGPVISEAVSFCSKAIELDPESDFSLLNLGVAYLSRAELDVNDARDPSTSLQQAQKTLLRAEAINPEYPEVDLATARAEFTLARWNVMRKKSYETNLISSRKAIENSLRINPRNADAYLLNAVLSRFESEQLIAKKHSAKLTIKSGIQYADKALSINPAFSEAEAVKGALLLLLAHSEKDVTAGKETAGKAETLFTKALNRNRNLARLYGPLRLQAQELFPR